MDSILYYEGVNIVERLQRALEIDEGVTITFKDIPSRNAYRQKLYRALRDAKMERREAYQDALQKIIGEKRLPTQEESEMLQNLILTGWEDFMVKTKPGCALWLGKQTKENLGIENIEKG